MQAHTHKQITHKEKNPQITHTHTDLLKDKIWEYMALTRVYTKVCVERAAANEGGV